MVLHAFLIAALVLVEVGLWQWRIALTGRGHKLAGALLGTLGAALQVTAISEVVTNLREPMMLAAYAVGVGGGVLAGCLLDDRSARRIDEVRVAAPADDGALVGQLRARGWPATATQGDGLGGAVTLVWVVVERRAVERLGADLEQLVPAAFWTVSPVGSARRSVLPAGFAMLPPSRRARLR